MPALPLDEAGKYVAAAYIVFLAVILIYVGIMAVRLRRLEGRIEQLGDGPGGNAPPAGGAGGAGDTASTSQETGRRSGGEDAPEATEAGVEPALETDGEAAKARSATREAGGRHDG